MKAEIKRAERFDWCVRSASEGKVWGFDDDEVPEAFRAAFEQVVA